MKPYQFKKCFASYSCYIDFIAIWNIYGPPKAIWTYQLEKTKQGIKFLKGAKHDH